MRTSTERFLAMTYFREIASRIQDLEIHDVTAGHILEYLLKDVADV